MAVASLVLGILSILLFFTVVPPFILGGLGVIFGIIGLTKAGQGAPNKELAIAGLVSGAIGIVAAIAFIALVVTTGDVVTHFSYTIVPPASTHRPPSAPLVARARALSRAHVPLPLETRGYRVTTTDI